MSLSERLKAAQAGEDDESALAAASAIKSPPPPVTAVAPTATARPAGSHRITDHAPTGPAAAGPARPARPVPVATNPATPAGSAAAQPSAPVPGTGPGASGGPRPHRTLSSAQRAARPTLTSVPAPQNDAISRLKDRAAAELFSRLGARLNDPSMNVEQLHALVRAELNAVLEEEDVPLSADQRNMLSRDIEDDVLGHGPLQKYLDDPDVTEVMVNGPDFIYIERGGRLTRAPARFNSEDQLRRVIERIVSRVGRRIDESSPLVDARLLDGSRVNAVIPPLSFTGPLLTIRKFSKDPYRVGDLIRFGSLTPEMAELLDACVKARLNILVSGGTGTGKTTLLNVLSSFIPENERIVTIEDAVELQLQQDHVVRLEARPPNIEGKGEITIRDLVRNSLRMRPDRIVVGEVRGGESLDMLQAMNTGHDGSLSTIHSNSPRDAISRLETLVLMAGMDLPLKAIREQIASAVDLIVQLTRLRDGTRRVTAVTEVHGMEGQTVTLQDVFLFDYSAGIDANGRFLGKPVSTGIRPRFTDRFEQLGITVNPRVFAPPQGRVRR